MSAWEKRYFSPGTPFEKQIYFIEHLQTELKYIEGLRKNTESSCDEIEALDNISELLYRMVKFEMEKKIYELTKTVHAMQKGDA